MSISAECTGLCLHFRRKLQFKNLSGIYNQPLHNNYVNSETISQYYVDLIHISDYSPLPPPSLSDPESTDTAPTSPPKSTPVLRNFECVCWELDPHLCLLSSAGTGQFNPHISWLLERLGFKHAQTTIPKWIQRVAMDPLDMVVANAMELLIKITATKKLQQKSRASSPPSHQLNQFQTFFYH